MEKLNILIIDRSSSFCEDLKGFLVDNDPVNEVKTTTDLLEGIDILSHVTIHIVILDVMYPDVKGQSALQTILSYQVLPVIVVAEPSVDQMVLTVTAMSNGAIDFIKKVNFQHREKLAKFEATLILKMQHVKKANRLRSIARKVKEHPLKDTLDEKKQPVNIVEPSLGIRADKEMLVVIGASTGGPRALHQVIQQIPKDFKQPILIVQHMPAGFTKSLAERLNSIGNIHVKEAVHGEKIKNGTAYLAPGNHHMEVKREQNGLAIELSQGHDYLPHRPSVDLLFKSVAELNDQHKLAVVLTGMGRDGADGVKEIKRREKEAVIIAESKETAVIDGMPRAIVEMDLATQVLRIEKIGLAMAEYCKQRGK